MDELLKQFKMYRDQIFEKFSVTGNYYDGKHSDSTAGISANENAACELSADVESRLSDIENALCDLSK